MTNITFKEDIKLSGTNFLDFSSFIEYFTKNNYPDSNIENEYSIASDMKNNGISDSFIKNFKKSYK